MCGGLQFRCGASFRFDDRFMACIKDGAEETVVM